MSGQTRPWRFGRLRSSRSHVEVLTSLTRAVAIVSRPVDARGGSGADEARINRPA
jgi:hypothetical protein